MKKPNALTLGLMISSMAAPALLATGCKHNEEAMAAAPVTGTQQQRVSPSEVASAVQNLPEPDRSFIQQASGANMAAIQIGKLGMERGTSDQVRNIASEMVDAHTKLHNDMRQAASEQGVDLPMGSMTPKQTALFSQLQQLQGPAFDSAFLQTVRQLQDDTIQSFQNEALNGQVQGLSRLANQSLPSLNNRVQTVRRAMNQM